MFNRFKAFLSNNWKPLTLAAVALTVGVVAVMFPPAALAGLTIALASSPVFAVFGSYAAAVATTVVAATVAASVAALTVASSLLLSRPFNWLATKFSRKPASGSGNDETDGLTLRSSTSDMNQSLTGHTSTRTEPQPHTQTHTRRVETSSFSSTLSNLGTFPLKKTGSTTPPVDDLETTSSTMGLTGQL